MDLLRAILRTTRLVPLSCSGVLAVLVMVAPIVLDADLDFIDATLSLHVSMLVLLLGSAFVLDDPARSMTEVLPISATRTMMLRMALALVPITVFWVTLLVLAPYTVTNSRAYERSGLVIEVYIALVWVWAVAAYAGAGRIGGIGSSVAAPFVLFLGVVLVMLPDRASLFLSPGTPGFADSRMRWLMFGAVGTILLWSAVSGRKRLPASLRSK